MRKVLITTTYSAYGSGGAGCSVHTVIVEFESEDEACRAIAKIGSQDLSSNNYRQWAVLL